MADIRKDQERDELHRAIWAIADGLRGSVDGWDFKSYVLGMMFYRYISENLTNYINEGEIEAGNEGFDYALLSDGDAEQAREDMRIWSMESCPKLVFRCYLMIMSKSRQT